MEEEDGNYFLVPAGFTGWNHSPSASPPPPAPSPSAAPVSMTLSSSSTLSAKNPPSAKMCMARGCHRQVKSKGLCKMHGGGIRCEVDGCDKAAQKERRCYEHGGKTCQVEGCEKHSQLRGLCYAHGGKPQQKKLCSVAGCKNMGRTKGRCRTHGGGGHQCLVDGCEKVAEPGGRCWTHGGGKRCAVDGCGKIAQAGGCCGGHGGGSRCQVDGCKKFSSGGHRCSAHGGGKRRLTNAQGDASSNANAREGGSATVSSNKMTSRGSFEAVLRQTPTWEDARSTTAGRWSKSDGIPSGLELLLVADSSINSQTQRKRRRETSVQPPKLDTQNGRSNSDDKFRSSESVEL